MNRIKFLTLACAAVAMLAGNQAFGVNPYDADNYGIQWAKAFGGNTGSMRSGDRGTMAGYGGNVYIAGWVYGDRIWPEASVINNDGSISGSWQSTTAKMDVNGNIVWSHYTDDRIPAGGSGNQSYEYNLTVAQSGAFAGHIATTGSGTRHDVGVNPNQITDGTDTNFTTYDSNGNIIGNILVGSGPNQLNTYPAQTSVLERGIEAAVNPVTGEVVHVGYTQNDYVAPGSYQVDGAAADRDPYIVKFDAAGNLLAGYQYGEQGGGNDDHSYFGDVAFSPDGQFVAATGWQDGGTAGLGTFAPYVGGTRDALVAIYNAATMAPVQTIQSPAGDAFRDNLTDATFDANNQLILAGYTGGGDGGQEHVGWLASMNPATGAINWQTSLDAAEAGSVDYFTNIEINPADGSIWTYGTTGGTLPGTGGLTAGTADNFVAKYSATGVLEFVKNFGNPGGQAETMTGFGVIDDATIMIGARQNASTGWLDYELNPIDLNGADRMSTYLKYTLGDFNGDGYTSWDDLDQLEVAVAGGPLVGNDTYDWDGDGNSSVADAVYMVANIYDTFYGDYSMNAQWDVEDLDRATKLATAGTFRAILDLDDDGDTDAADVAKWLADAATAHGHASPYKLADSDLDRDVDITDFNNLASNFDPTGANHATDYNHYAEGDFDGDTDIDITDFNILASNFAPGGYDGAAADVAADADPGKIDLIVDIATGEVWVDGNAASISGFQIVSGTNGLIPGDLVPAVLTIMVGAPTNGFYAEGAFANSAVNGLTSLGILYDVNLQATDLAFEYTFLNNPTAEQGAVIYVPEPASLVLMGLGGLMVLRRRRAA